MSFFGLGQSAEVKIVLDGVEKRLTLFPSYDYIVILKHTGLIALNDILQLVQAKAGPPRQ